MRRLGLSQIASLAVLALVSTPAQAVIDLQITEIWVGQDGSDLTDDWFELTNYGDEAWIAGISPVMTVNDNSGGLGTDDLVEGLTDIQPGESAIIIMEGSLADKTTFFDVWNPVKPQDLTNIGYADGVPSGGLGLGQGGDSVNVYLNDILEDSESYTSAPSGVSWDVPLGEYSVVGNASGAVATLAVNDMGEPAVGSPGSVVPEPGCVILLVLGAVGLAFGNRHR
jgi:hypothetical protein